MPDILHPATGTPTTSVRRTVMQIEIIDQKALDPHATKAAFKVQLDVRERQVVARLLDQVKQAAIAHLEEIGFFNETQVPNQTDNQRRLPDAITSVDGLGGLVRSAR